jgi:hypothetical protein
VLLMALLGVPVAGQAAQAARPMSGTEAWSTTPALTTPKAAVAPAQALVPATALVPDATPPDTRALDEAIQSIKKDVVDLNRDLFILEEELLFPANTQVAVFLSMDVGEFFALDTVELRMDDKQVAKHLYTPREAEALL